MFSRRAAAAHQSIGATVEWLVARPPTRISAFPLSAAERRKTA
ncbi:MULTISPECIES: hypothetical protein [unclassified Frankia]|nr:MULTISPECIES: hypothetical protein [unclassified Frankia]